MHRNKTVACALILCLLLNILAGCDRSSQGKVFRYDISGPVTNLDPQFATDANARLIITNIYEGLVVQNADGEILPGAAEHYTVSPDGLRWTFTLREGLLWEDGTLLTSADFLFSFQRLFSPASPSPFAGDYLCLASAADILEGRASVGSLGVTAPDAHTLVFQLESETPSFLELLCATPAMPCNQEFFGQARGRYGLDLASVYANGPFVLDRWDNDRYITVTRNENYVSALPVLAGGVNFYIGRENTLKQFRDGNSDLVIVPHGQLPGIQNKVSELYSFDKTTWCIVFNQNDTVLGNALIRQGLVHAADLELVAEQLDSEYSITRLFVPPAMHLSGVSFREMAGAESPLPFHTERAAYLYGLGLHALELEAIPPLTLLVPEEAEHELYMSQLQQVWQRYLNVQVNLETVPADQIERRFRQGSYQMLLMPFSPTTGRVDSLLGAFASTSTQNYTGYENPFYDSLLQNASQESDIARIAAGYANAETLLLHDAVILPVYLETTIYAVSEKTSGIDVLPFAGHIYFKYAQK